MLHSRLHRVTVTHCERHYAGSCYNISNGERFSTYAIRAERRSGISSLNGAAVREAAVVDVAIIATYAAFSEGELKYYRPIIVHVDAHNRAVSEIKSLAVQML